MTAQEMFKELGYSRSVTESNDIVYARCLKPFYIERTWFYMEKKQVLCELKYISYPERPLSTTMAELKAINKQCEELGWL